MRKMFLYLVGLSCVFSEVVMTKNMNITLSLLAYL